MDSAGYVKCFFFRQKNLLSFNFVQFLSKKNHGLADKFFVHSVSFSCQMEKKDDSGIRLREDNTPSFKPFVFHHISGLLVSFWQKCF